MNFDASGGDIFRQKKLGFVLGAITVFGTPAFGETWTCTFSRSMSFDITITEDGASWIQDGVTVPAQYMYDPTMGIMVVTAHPDPKEHSIQTTNIYIGSKFGQEFGVPVGAATLTMPGFLSNGILINTSGDSGRCNVNL